MITSSCYNIICTQEIKHEITARLSVTWHRLLLLIPIIMIIILTELNADLFLFLTEKSLQSESKSAKVKTC